MTAPLLWPDDRSEKLRTLWANGWSARLCAEELGVSRNAIIGRVHRMGLEARGRQVKVDRSHMPRKPRKRGLHTPHQRDTFGKLVSPFAFVPREAEVTPRHLTWEEISPGDGLCHQSYGENAPFTYCGHQAQDRSSYCPVHHAINYIPWRPRMDREEFHLTRRENFRAYKAELVGA